MDEPDPAVIRAAAAGDHAAFGVLVRDGQAHVWRFLRHLLGDEELAADLTQETFLRVHRALPRYRFESRFTTWLFRIARNAAIDEQRRMTRRRRVLQQERVEAAVSQGPALGVELSSALASLDAEHREVFVLVEVFGLKYREVAVVLEMPQGTVKSRVFRARRHLVEWFEAAGDQQGATGER